MKAIEYVRRYNPIILNDLHFMQFLRNRREVYRLLQEARIPIPNHMVVDHDAVARGEKHFEEHYDYIVYDGMKLNKPFIEKPVDADDHNNWIYYSRNTGGGVKKLFRKVENRSSAFSPELHQVRKDGVYLYEEFLSTHGTDIKVYTVGGGFAHAEARKAPSLDGRVQRTAEGKELRFPVLLKEEEKMIAFKIVHKFRQFVCGFDILRTKHGRPVVCDVNGWSFVKGNDKYYRDCSHIIRLQFLEKYNLRQGIPRPFHHIHHHLPSNNPSAVYSFNLSAHNNCSSVATDVADNRNSLSQPSHHQRHHSFSIGAHAINSNHKHITSNSQYCGNTGLIMAAGDVALPSAISNLSVFNNSNKNEEFDTQKDNNNNSNSSNNNNSTSNHMSLLHLGTSRFLSIFNRTTSYLFRARLQESLRRTFVDADEQLNLQLGSVRPPPITSQRDVVCNVKDCTGSSFKGEMCVCHSTTATTTNLTGDADVNKVHAFGGTVASPTVFGSNSNSLNAAHSDEEHHHHVSSFGGGGFHHRPGCPSRIYSKDGLEGFNGNSIEYMLHHAAGNTSVSPGVANVEFSDDDADEEELRVVVVVMRHGDRKPKQKIKFETCNPHILSLFHPAHYGPLCAVNPSLKQTQTDKEKTEPEDAPHSIIASTTAGGKKPTLIPSGSASNSALTNLSPQVCQPTGGTVSPSADHHATSKPSSSPANSTSSSKKAPPQDKELKLKSPEELQSLLERVRRLQHQEHLAARSAAAVLLNINNNNTTNTTTNINNSAIAINNTTVNMNVMDVTLGNSGSNKSLFKNVTGNDNITTSSKQQQQQQIHQASINFTPTPPIATMTPSAAAAPPLVTSKTAAKAVDKNKREELMGFHRLRKILQTGDGFTGINRKIQLKPVAWTYPTDSKSFQQQQSCNLAPDSSSNINSDADISTTTTTTNNNNNQVNNKVSFETLSTDASGAPSVSPPSDLTPAVPGALSSVFLPGMIVARVLVVAKWGGELTEVGRAQAEDLGVRMRVGLYPGGESDGLLRLHSTFRHDFKIYSSDEGRCQVTSAAFTKGFLDLDGPLTPILVQLVTRDAKAHALLDDSRPSKQRALVKEKLQSALNEDIDLATESDRLVSLAPTSMNSGLVRALMEIKNPKARLSELQTVVDGFVSQIENEIAHIKLLIDDLESIAKHHEDAQNFNDSKIQQQQPNSTNIVVSSAHKDSIPLQNNKNANLDQNDDIGTIIDGNNNNNMACLEPPIDGATAIAEEAEHIADNEHKATKHSSPHSDPEAQIAIQELREYGQKHVDVLEDIHNRWKDLQKGLAANKKTKLIDASKVPDVVDHIRFDLVHHHSHLGDALEAAFKVLAVAEPLGNYAQPQEYGLTAEEKVEIGASVVSKLLKKILRDLTFWRDEASHPKTGSKSQVHGSVKKPQPTERLTVEDMNDDGEQSNKKSISSIKDGSSETNETNKEKDEVNIKDSFSISACPYKARKLESVSFATNIEEKKAPLLSLSSKTLDTVVQYLPSDLQNSKNNLEMNKEHINAGENEDDELASHVSPTVAANTVILHNSDRHLPNLPIGVANSSLQSVAPLTDQQSRSLSQSLQEPPLTASPSLLPSAFAIPTSPILPSISVESNPADVIGGGGNTATLRVINSESMWAHNAANLPHFNTGLSSGAATETGGSQDVAANAKAYHMKVCSDPASRMGAPSGPPMTCSCEPLPESNVVVNHAPICYLSQRSPACAAGLPPTMKSSSGGHMHAPSCVLDDDDAFTPMLDAEGAAAMGIKSPWRHVRSRFYVTSASHLQSLLNILMYGHLFSRKGGEPDEPLIHPKAQHAAAEITDLHYLTHVAIRLWERRHRPQNDPEKYRVELLFSTGAQDGVGQSFAALKIDAQSHQEVLKGLLKRAADFNGGDVDEGEDQHHHDEHDDHDDAGTAIDRAEVTSVCAHEQPFSHHPPHYPSFVSPDQHAQYMSQSQQFKPSGGAVDSGMSVDENIRQANESEHCFGENKTENDIINGSCLNNKDSKTHPAAEEQDVKFHADECELRSHLPSRANSLIGGVASPSDSALPPPASFHAQTSLLDARGRLRLPSGVEVPSATVSSSQSPLAPHAVYDLVEAAVTTPNSGLNGRITSLLGLETEVNDSRGENYYWSNIMNNNSVSDGGDHLVTADEHYAATGVVSSDITQNQNLPHSSTTAANLLVRKKSILNANSSVAPHESQIEFANHAAPFISDEDLPFNLTSNKTSSHPRITNNNNNSITLNTGIASGVLTAKRSSLTSPNSSNNPLEILHQTDLAVNINNNINNAASNNNSSSALDSSPIGLTPSSSTHQISSPPILAGVAVPVTGTKGSSAALSNLAHFAKNPNAHRNTTADPLVSSMCCIPNVGLDRRLQDADGCDLEEDAEEEAFHAGLVSEFEEEEEEEIQGRIVEESAASSSIGGLSKVENLPLQSSLSHEKTVKDKTNIACNEAIGEGINVMNDSSISVPAANQAVNLESSYSSPSFYSANPNLSGGGSSSQQTCNQIQTSLLETNAQPQNIPLLLNPTSSLVTQPKEGDILTNASVHPGPFYKDRPLHPRVPLPSLNATRGIISNPQPQSMASNNNAAQVPAIISATQLQQPANSQPSKSNSPHNIVNAAGGTTNQRHSPASKRCAQSNAQSEVASPPPASLADPADAPSLLLATSIATEDNHHHQQQQQLHSNHHNNSHFGMSSDLFMAAVATHLSTPSQRNSPRANLCHPPHLSHHPNSGMPLNTTNSTNNSNPSHPISSSSNMTYGLASSGAPPAIPPPPNYSQAYAAAATFPKNSYPEFYPTGAITASSQALNQVLQNVNSSSSLHRTQQQQQTEGNSSLINTNNNNSTNNISSGLGLRTGGVLERDGLSSSVFNCAGGMTTTSNLNYLSGVLQHGSNNAISHTASVHNFAHTPNNNHNNLNTSNAHNNASSAALHSQLHQSSLYYDPLGTPSLPIKFSTHDPASNTSSPPRNVETPPPVSSFSLVPLGPAVLSPAACSTEDRLLVHPCSSDGFEGSNAQNSSEIVGEPRAVDDHASFVKTSSALEDMHLHAAASNTMNQSARLKANYTATNQNNTNNDVNVDNDAGFFGADFSFTPPPLNESIDSTTLAALSNGLVIGSNINNNVVVMKTMSASNENTVETPSSDVNLINLHSIDSLVKQREDNLTDNNNIQLPTDSLRTENHLMTSELLSVNQNKHDDIDADLNSPHFNINNFPGNNNAIHHHLITNSRDSPIFDPLSAGGMLEVNEDVLAHEAAPPPPDEFDDEVPPYCRVKPLLKFNGDLSIETLERVINGVIARFGTYTAASNSKSGGNISD